MQELYEHINEQVAREARLAAGKWNGMVDAGDIEQELWLWIMERPATQKFLLGAEPAQIASSLASRAHDICSKERISYEHFSGQFVYTPAEVRDLLDTYWGSDVHHISPEVMALAEAELSPTMIQNILGGTISSDEKVDIEQALAELEDIQPNYYFVLHEAYAAGIEPSDRKQKQRAVDKLATLMNRKRSQREMDRHEGPGTKPKIVMEEY